MQDRPRLFRDPAAITEREKQIDRAHVAPLNEWVRDLRTRFGDDAIIPWFDPWDAGVNARVLWLLEAPGPKATREGGGSGFISPNNNDSTAQNAWETRADAGVPRSVVVHWNVIPYYLGRSFTTADIDVAGPLLRELLDLLPGVGAVILGGKAAQRSWRRFAPATRQLVTEECPHASPQNVNTRPSARGEIVLAWARAYEAVGGVPAITPPPRDTAPRHASDSLEQRRPRS
jgi:hypothetical protein